MIWKSSKNLRKEKDREINKRKNIDRMKAKKEFKNVLKKIN